MRKKVNIKEQELNVNTATMINEEEKDSTVVAVQVSETEVEHEDVKEQIPIKLSDDIYIREGEAPWIGVQIYNYLSDEVVEVKFKVDDFTADSMKKAILLNGGICTDAVAQYEWIIKEYYRRLKSGEISKVSLHDELGWRKKNKEVVFYGQKAVALSDIQSEYDGENNVKPVGNINNFVEMIKTWILGCKEWSPLQAIIAFAVGATVLPFARIYWGKEIDNIIIHLIGGSTTGKSTSLKLHTAFGSTISDKKKGFLISFQSSLVAVIRRIGTNWGFPVAIDELSSGSRKDYDEFVYALGNGEEKDRMKAGGTGLQKSSTFSTVVLSSGEISLHRKCSMNEGIRVRSVEIPNEYWTESKEQAEAIAECLQGNYGLVTPLVAKELLENSDFWQERWNELVKKANTKITKDKICLSYAHRLINFVVLFTLSAELANKILDITLDVERIFKFCYQYIIVANANEANLAERAYACILGHFGNNRHLFPEGEYNGCKTQFNDYILTSDDEGFYRAARRKTKILGVEYDKQVVFRMSAMERILDENGFSPKVTLNKLKEARLLSTKDNYRCTAKMTINGVEQDVVIVYYKSDVEDGIEVADVD